MFTRDARWQPSRTAAYKALIVALLTAFAVAVAPSRAWAATASAPTNVSAVRVPSGVQLSWKAPTSTGGLPVLAYYYDISYDGGSTWNSAYYGGTATAVVDTACGEGQSCTYRIYAYTNAGQGAYSTAVTAG
jgi:hypothetical protein